MNKFTQIITRPIVLLSVGLVFGLSCFVIVLKFITSYTQKSAALIGFFFLPAIVCGTALLFIKQAKMWKDEENHRAIKFLISFGAVIFFLAVIFLADIIFNG
ncbi:MAG: hypothetical protein N2171_03065 [Clostridia bacterium]|nr:hypothetical protein [Clostridia bacterium]